MSLSKKKNVLIHAPVGCSVGAACQTAFAEDGARVYMTHAAEPFDQLSDAGWENMLRQCRQQLPALDTFVCCAPRGGVGKSIVASSMSEFRDTLYGSALASWLGQKHAIMEMRGNAAGGTVVHITSVLAKSAADDSAARCAAEAGILMSSKAAALECAKNQDSILVHTLLAGPIEEDGTPVRPQGAPLVAAADVANAALFLASAAASYMTGTELAVDRGFLSR